MESKAKEIIKQISVNHALDTTFGKEFDEIVEKMDDEENMNIDNVEAILYKAFEERLEKEIKNDKYVECGVFREIYAGFYFRMRDKAFLETYKDFEEKCMDAIDIGLDKVFANPEEVIQTENQSEHDPENLEGRSSKWFANALERSFWTEYENNLDTLFEGSNIKARHLDLLRKDFERKMKRHKYLKYGY